LYQHRYNAREENRACREQDGSHTRDQFALLLSRFGFGSDIGRQSCDRGWHLDRQGKPFPATGIRRA
jgi:hypothetical protein